MIPADNKPIIPAMGLTNKANIEAKPESKAPKRIKPIIITATSLEVSILYKKHFAIYYLPLT
jgi:hypothetical protein